MGTTHMIDFLSRLHASRALAISRNNSFSQVRVMRSAPKGCPYICQDPHRQSSRRAVLDEDAENSPSRYLPPHFCMLLSLVQHLS